MLFASGLGSLLLEVSLASGLAGSGLLGGSLTQLFGGRVESLHQSAVLERVLLVLVVQLIVALDHSELALDLVRVDDSGKVSNVHLVSGELVASLLDTLGTVSAEDIVKSFEGIFGEDDESSDVTTWGKLEEVQSANMTDINSWQVAGISLD